MPGHVGVDQRLGPPRIEIPLVLAVLAVLGVEVEDRAIAGPASRTRTRAEAGGQRAAADAPPAGSGADRASQPLGGGPLGRAGNRDRRVLLESVFGTPQRPGRQLVSRDSRPGEAGKSDGSSDEREREAHPVSVVDRACRA